MFNNRYGTDKLTWAMLLLAVMVSVIGMFLPQGAKSVLITVSTVFTILAVLRMFSRNFTARRNELYKYLQFENKLKNRWATITKKRGKIINLKDRRNYRYFTCGYCMQKLRVPRNKGRIRITCTKCGHKFEAKT